MRKRPAMLSPIGAESVVKGCSKYVRAMSRGQSMKRSDGDVQRQFDRYRAVLEQQAARNDYVRQICCGLGVPLLQFMTYYNFAARIGKLIRMGLRDAVPIEINRWAATGLDRTVLSRICTDVFNVMLGTNPIDGCDKGGVESNGAGTGNEPANRTHEFVRP